LVHNDGVQGVVAFHKLPGNLAYCKTHDKPMIVSQTVHIPQPPPPPKIVKVEVNY